MEDNPDSYIIISPDFPPRRGGLSDYTAQFCSHLARSHRVGLVTHQNVYERDLPENVELITKLETWGLINCFFLFFKIFRNFPERKLIIQWVPYMYGRAGINFFFPLICVLFRLIGGPKIIIILHELHYPFELRVKSFIIYFSHRIMLLLMTMSGSLFFISTEYLKKCFLSYFPWKKPQTFLLSVPSNITSSVKDEGRERESSFRFVHFGSFHPTKRSEEIIPLLLSEFSEEEVTIDFIGPSREEARDFFGDDVFEGIVSKCSFLGNLSTEKVGETLVKGDALLCFFSDGMSTRRGSLMAALYYGLPILTTVTQRSDSILKEGPLWTSKEGPLDFIKMIRHFKEDIHPNLDRDHHIEESRLFYEEHFSWEKMIKLFKSTVVSI